MRVFFAGSPRLAVPALEALSCNHTVCGVLTNPDQSKGRLKKLEPTPVKAKALSLSLSVFQPEKLDKPLLEKIKELDTEILVVVAYGRIFKKEFIDLFPGGGVNLHPSLLPKYRGPSPIPAVLLAGENKTGVTIQRLALKMDSGAILAQEQFPLTGTETTLSLSEFVSEIGARLLVSTLDEIEQGTVTELVQQENEATYCHLLVKEDGKIDWNHSAETIERMIRAYTPWPGSYTSYKGQDLYLLSSSVYRKCAEKQEKGLVLGTDKQYGILVNTGRGVLSVNRLQLQSRKKLDWKAFLNGQKDFIGALLD